MTSLFQVIAHEDANDQSKLRQASALAHQRVEDRFGSFVRKGSIEDQGARYSLVEEDVRAVVAAACAQVGFADVDGILSSIGKNFISAPEARKVAGGAPWSVGQTVSSGKGEGTVEKVGVSNDGDRWEATVYLADGKTTTLYSDRKEARTASTIHEARKPKMCRYHSEVTDISLAQGEAQAGFNAMAQHAWSDNHCQGEGYKGDKCKFKPAMTTQAFWDDKAEKSQQRRDERAEREQQLEQEPVTEVETPLEEVAEPVAEVEEIHEHSEPSAIGEGVSEAPEPMLMAAKTADLNEGVPEDGTCTVCGNALNSQKHQSGCTAARNSAIKVADDGLGGSGTAFPKMDKSKWTPKNVSELHEDDKDGPHPTKRKDVTEAIQHDQGSRYNPSKLEDIGEQVTEHQDVTKKVDNIKGDGGTFPGGSTTAVSSLLDQEKVREALSKFKR